MNTSTPVAVITGASRGIGAALIPAYRALDYGVVAVARTIADSTDPDMLTVSADISEPGAGDRIVAAALRRFGRIDTVVNNAGIFVARPFTEYTDADYDAVLGVNVRGFFELTRAAMPTLLHGGRGHVVTISTTLVEHANSALPSVLASLSKGGLTAATRSLAIEYAGRGVRANAVALGVIDTPMHAPETHAALAALHPVGRLGEISDVVDAVRYLETAPFVTGEILHVDGGQSAGH